MLQHPLNVPPRIELAPEIRQHAAVSSLLKRVEEFPDALDVALTTLPSPRLVVRNRLIVPALLCLLERLADFEHLDEKAVRQ